MAAGSCNPDHGATMFCMLAFVPNASDPDAAQTGRVCTLVSQVGLRADGLIAHCSVAQPLHAAAPGR